MQKIPRTDIYYGVRAAVKAADLSTKADHQAAPQKLVSTEAKGSAPHSVKNEAQSASST